MGEIEKHNDLEAEPKTQLIIRGHHIYRYIEFMAEISSMKQSGENMTREIIVREIQKYIAHFVKKLKRNEESYVKDVLGDTGEAAFIENMTQQFLLFLFSQPAYPVKLTTGIDGICGGCATGSHCHVLQRYDQIVLKKVADRLEKKLTEKDGGHLELVLSLSELRDLVLKKKV